MLTSRMALGDSPLISCRMDWIVGTNMHYQEFNSEQVLFTIGDLPQGTIVSGIKLKCSNAQRDGAETHPLVSARTHGTTPPRISAIGHFSTAAGILFCPHVTLSRPTQRLSLSAKLSSCTVLH